MVGLICLINTKYIGTMCLLFVAMKSFLLVAVLYLPDGMPLALGRLLAVVIIFATLINSLARDVRLKLELFNNAMLGLFLSELRLFHSFFWDYFLALLVLGLASLKLLYLLLAQLDLVMIAKVTASRGSGSLSSAPFQFDSCRSSRLSSASSGLRPPP